MSDESSLLLFEVSWEVCNKVGGMHTVITSKAQQAVGRFGDRYCLLGPDLHSNADFEETHEACWGPLRQALDNKDLPCRFGRWQIPGEPKVILVNFTRKYNTDQLLHELWQDHGVDSISGGPDYVEPVTFGHACGEVVETAYQLLARPKGLRLVAHFHEWSSGAGLLRLRKSAPEAGTVFTTHDTVLGRALASSGVDIYHKLEDISPQAAARERNVVAKCSMETAVAREADCFTTVSDITSHEAKGFLGRAADVVLPNGLDIGNIPDFGAERAVPAAARAKLLKFAAKFLGRKFGDNTKLLLISGNYEFHNKGIDVFLEALGELDKAPPRGQDILAAVCVLGDHKGVNPEAMLVGHGRKPPLCTHKLKNEASDPILLACERLKLHNSPANHVGVLYIPAALDGRDGILDMPYYELLAACDLGVFPSYYEPWGYTPLESAAYAVPTVTTDFAGFGIWASQAAGNQGGVTILQRHGKDVGTLTMELSTTVRGLLELSTADFARRRRAARSVAAQADWSRFYSHYLEAYSESLRVAAARASARAEPDGKAAIAAKTSSVPCLRGLTAVSCLPEPLRRLRELAYNLWWAWHPEAQELFSRLDPELWDRTNHNPLRTLECVSAAKLAAAAADRGHLALYAKVMKAFDAYLLRKSDPALELGGVLGPDSPVAYFSAEYGIHESLPIYSGGLGVLSGDTMKSASDLGAPLVGVGLLYKNGYFSQRIDASGAQQADYPENDFATLPVQPLAGPDGAGLLVELDLPGRRLQARIWEAKVGKARLLLLDTDIPANTPQDRKITAQLYVGDAKARLEQELLLGVGGVRALRLLKIAPVLFHMNEGHSAFLLLERIEEGMLGGLGFDEACEVVKASSVFTTHTPVEAGNERFDRKLMEIYFSSFVVRHAIGWPRFWDLGRKDPGDDQPFFMTVLALNLSCRANGVSRMHGGVSRAMWRQLWRGFLPSDVPIGHVTNGAHFPTFVAPRIKALLDAHVAKDWQERADDPKLWGKVHAIPDAELWKAKRELKAELVAFLVERLNRQWSRNGVPRARRDETLAKLDPAALFVGFARRFASYKRATLLFSDPDRLERIVSHPDRPVVFLFAGKAHPNDQPGQELIRKVVELSNDPRFHGKVFFVENYDTRVARHLLQGVDVWLNNPRRPYEASGTSGEKAVISGTLNLSVSDGWWCEGLDGSNGWTIGPAVTEFSPEALEACSDEEDARSLHALLEDEVAPLFYDRDAAGLPHGWLGRMKNSIATLAPKFNSDRMLKDYFATMFAPAAVRALAVQADGCKLAKELAEWKRKIPMKFSSLQLRELRVDGVEGDAVPTGRPFVVEVVVDPGRMRPDDLLVELVVGEANARGFVGTPSRVKMKPSGRRGGALLYKASHVFEENGQHSYGVRVMPFHPALVPLEQPGLIAWG